MRVLTYLTHLFLCLVHSHKDQDEFVHRPCYVSSSEATEMFLYAGLTCPSVFTKVCGIKERIPQFHGAPLQLLGEALCGGTSAIRVHLQQ